jgi:hypothetical protein
VEPISPAKLRLPNVPAIVRYNDRERAFFAALAASGRMRTRALIPTLFPYDPPLNASIIVADTARALARKLELNEETIELSRYRDGHSVLLELRSLAA